MNYKILRMFCTQSPKRQVLNIYKKLTYVVKPGELKPWFIFIFDTLKEKKIPSNFLCTNCLRKTLFWLILLCLSRDNLIPPPPINKECFPKILKIILKKLKSHFKKLLWLNLTKRNRQCRHKQKSRGGWVSRRILKFSSLQQGIENLNYTFECMFLLSCIQDCATCGKAKKFPLYLSWLFADKIKN